MQGVGADLVDDVVDDSLEQGAFVGATDATPVARALLLERLAWAAARCHAPDTCRRALDAVDDAYDQRSPGISEPEWVYWLNRAEIDVMVARCHIQLGQPAAAEPLLTRALSGYNPDHVREVGLYQTWLAEGYARTGNHDAAATSSTRSTPAPSTPALSASNAASTPSPA